MTVFYKTNHNKRLYDGLILHNYTFGINYELSKVNVLKKIKVDLVEFGLNTIG